MRLTWHNYRYYPYERVLAAREIQALLDPTTQTEVSDGIEIQGNVETRQVARLTYFSGAVNGHGLVPTIQSQLEEAGRSGKKKQATRYSVHGMHEYKGKFNPQVARVLLNIFGVQEGHHVLDPFCGSGTTLVECSHIGANGFGTDINPFAVMVARAKLLALRTPVAKLQEIHDRLSVVLVEKSTGWTLLEDTRLAYLRSWFDADMLDEIEFIRTRILECSGELAPVFLIIASNLLRDYSQQDPGDLRIRRRKSPLPETPFTVALLDAARPLLARIDATQAILGTNLPESQAVLRDVSELALDDLVGPFDAAITSPPYAMALPYIDTQRLSLVWLGLVDPSSILQLESELIGSREMRGNARRLLPDQLAENASSLPAEEAKLCLDLHHALGEKDGFRRQAVPMLLYRYFAAMKESFRSVKSVLKAGAPYGLIVGHNHSTIGGLRRDFDTPRHLANLAVSEGWRVEELIPLQTYHRYGYHVDNAVAAETLIILRNG